MLTVWLRVFFFRFMWILIQTSATILFSLCSELVTCTSFVRQNDKNWCHKFPVSFVLKVLRVFRVICPPLFRAMFFRISKSVVIITVTESMGNKYRGKNAYFAICLKVLLVSYSCKFLVIIWTDTILTECLTAGDHVYLLVCITREGWRDKSLFSLAIG